MQDLSCDGSSYAWLAVVSRWGRDLSYSRAVGDGGQFTLRFPAINIEKPSHHTTTQRNNRGTPTTRRKTHFFRYCITYIQATVSDSLNTWPHDRSGLPGTQAQSPQSPQRHITISPFIERRFSITTFIFRSCCATLLRALKSYGELARGSVARPHLYALHLGRSEHWTCLCPSSLHLSHVTPSKQPDAVPFSTLQRSDGEPALFYLPVSRKRLRLSNSLHRLKADSLRNRSPAHPTSCLSC